MSINCAGNNQAALVYALLGIPDAGYGLENARLVGREVQQFAAEYGDFVSLGYATQILREFRESVLEEFFTIYPDAGFIRNWHNLAEAVLRFTTHNNVGWKPKFEGVQSSVQKMQLLQSLNPGKVTVYNVTTGRLLLRQDGHFVHHVLVTHYEHHGIDDGFGDTILRLPHGGLVYAGHIPAAN
jgi:hypothetical protein